MTLVSPAAIVYPHNPIKARACQGSHTALLPYARDRYFENHKILSVTDKLHKLYGSTLTPIVWARSVGLEVLNELSAVKGALMFSAGAQGFRAKGTDGSGWNAAASTVEALAGGADLAKLIRESISNLASYAATNVAGVARRA